MADKEQRRDYKSSMCLYALLLSIFAVGAAATGTIVTSLPGYAGDLRFTLETGYVGVGETEEVQLFYYFVESQRSPSEDPLMLWLTGGPGCSVLSAFFFENGPVSFTFVGYNGSIPQLHDNPYAWTQGLNILYVDQPVGTGFSYSTTQEGYVTDDLTSASDTYQFLRKWMMEHPQYLTNILYIGGDSYSGITLPIVVEKIIDGNEVGLYPYLNLRGYVLGNPKTDSYIDDNSRVPFAHRLTLISDELYKSTKTSCNGDYVNINSSNVDCVTDMDTIDELLLQINLMNVLEPVCQTASPTPKGAYNGRRSLKDDISIDDLLSQPNPALWCRDYNYVLAAVWANDKSVREALNVRENTTGVWKRCNITGLAYTKTVTSSVEYHRNLSARSDLRALIYSGDHDLSVTHLGTQNWINSLNLTLDESWRAWYVDGQVAGYTVKYTSNDYNIVYATIKGAGHVAPEYKPKECYAMVDRWLAYYPL